MVLYKILNHIHILFEINRECTDTQCDMFYGFGDGDRHRHIFHHWCCVWWVVLMSIGDVTTVINDETIDRSTNAEYMDTLSITALSIMMKQHGMYGNSRSKFSSAHRQL